MSHLPFTRRNTLLSCLASLALALPGSGVWAQSPGKTLRMASGVGFTTFDPVAATPPTVDYLRPVYDTLIVRQGIDQFGPGLATAWAYADGNRKLVFTLRSGVHFSDGAVFDAAAVKQNLDRGRAATASPWADVYRAIDSVKVLSPTQIELSLTASNAALIENFANNPGMMVSPNALKDEAALAKEPVGTAPWKLDTGRSIRGDRYVYTRNASHWNAAARSFETVVIQQMTEAAARTNALRSGQLDVATVPQDQAGALERLGFRIHVANKVYYMLSVWDARGTAVKALADARVRRAISLAIDRQAVLKAIFGGRGTASLNFFPPGAGGYSAALANTRAHDPEQARQLLRDAGHGAGFEADVVVQTNNARFAAAVAGELAKIGVRLNIKTMPDVGSFQAAVRQRQSHLGIFAHQTALPATLYSSLLSPQGRYNPFKLSNPDLDAFAHAVSERAPAQAQQSYGMLFERVVAQEALVFPVVTAEIVSAMRKGIDGGPTTFANAGLPDPRNVVVAPN